MAVAKRPDKKKMPTAVVGNLWKDPHFFSGESEADFDKLRSEYLLELRPRTPYERSLAEDLVRFEWEISRYRRLRDAKVLAAYREYVISVLERGNPFPDFTNHHKIKEENLLIATDICSKDPKKRLRAELEFGKRSRYTCQELLVKAFASVDDVGVIERRIADIELRRRRLREEYQRLRLVVGHEIEEAEVAGEGA